MTSLAQYDMWSHNMTCGHTIDNFLHLWIDKKGGHFEHFPQIQAGFIHFPHCARLMGHSLAEKMWCRISSKATGICTLHQGVWGMGVQLRAFLDSALVRGFEPGRSRRIFQGEKILSMLSFGREVKPLVSCRRFKACKRSLQWRGSRHCRQKYRSFLTHRFPFLF
jgi:hypothetical protein